MAGDLTPEQGQKGGWHSGRFAHTFAAIDLGTNNCRLLVARASVDGYEVIDAYSRPVRLGEGVALIAFRGDAPMAGGWGAGPPGGTKRAQRGLPAPPNPPPNPPRRA